MTNIYVKFHHADYGFYQEAFQEVFRMVDGVKEFPEKPKYFNRMTDFSNDWYTVNSSGSYWENSSDVKSNIKFTICNNNGNIVYFDDAKNYIPIRNYVNSYGDKFAK